MESTSLHGRVQVSSATHALVESSNAGAFSWVPRLSVRGTRSCGCFRVQFVSHKKTQVPVKGKGNLDTFFVVGTPSGTLPPVDAHGPCLHSDAHAAQTLSLAHE